MLKDILPNYIYNSLNKLPYKKIQELRLRENNKVVVNVDGENFYLTHEGIDKNINYAIDVEKGLLQNIINRISNNSLYAINDQLVNGYTTIKGGIRLGVCGEIVEVNKEIKTIKNISSINFRFPHFIKNCSLKIYNYLVDNGNIKSTLIISPPGAGKTTLLRDLIYQISNREKLLNILIVDERKEISSVFDGDEIISLKNVDIYSNSSKKFGFNNGIRSMKPDVIFTDEISIDNDLDDLLVALTSGVKIIATIHASSIYDLRKKTSFHTILNNNLFERFVVLSNDYGVGTIDGVFDENLNFLGV